MFYRHRGAGASMSQGISEQDISKQDAEQKTAKPKHIVLLSDGTGNSSAKVFKTNVWRLFQILDLRDPTSQIAYYDDGVGTSSFKAFAILGGVFGFGLKRNVIDIYSFCCRNYKAGDYIYCFGFSRGAFTIRIVAGMIARQGLVEYKNNEADLARFAADAYRLYRRRFTGGILKFLPFLRDIRDFAIRQWRGIWHQEASAPGWTEGREYSLRGALGHSGCLWWSDRGDDPGDRLLGLAIVDAGSFHERESPQGVPRIGAGRRARRISSGDLGRALRPRHRQDSRPGER